MTGSQQQQEQAQKALWSIPSYVGSALQEESRELTTGPDLGKIVESIRRAKTSTEGANHADEDLESFKTYGYITRRFEDLLAEPEEDEFGKVRPATAAVAEAKRRMFQIAEGKVLPKPEDISTDRDGGIRVSWRNDGRFLEFVFPYETDLRPYIYYSEGPLFEISEDLTTSQLRRWVRWVEGDPRPK